MGHTRHLDDIPYKVEIEYEIKGCFDPKEVENNLPEHKKQLMHRPEWNDTQIRAPMTKCKVVYVNKKHHWYTVEYEQGFRESFKIPLGGYYGEMESL